MARPKIKSVDKLTNTQLYKQTEKLVNEANKRLSRLEKGIDLNKGRYNPKTKRFERVGSYTIINDKGKRVRIKEKNIIKYKGNTWASKKLAEKLSSYSIKDNKININKNMSRAELLNIRKTTLNFLESKTSTAKGIREVEKQTRENIFKEIEDITDIDSEDINTLYDFFNDKDFIDTTNFIDPSDLWYLLAEAKSQEMTQPEFLDLIGNYIDRDSLGTDVDLQNKLTRIYNKFV